MAILIQNDSIGGGNDTHNDLVDRGNVKKLFDRWR